MLGIFDVLCNYISLSNLGNDIFCSMNFRHSKYMYQAYQLAIFIYIYEYNVWLSYLYNKLLELLIIMRHSISIVILLMIYCALCNIILYDIVVFTPFLYIKLFFKYYRSNNIYDTLIWYTLCLIDMYPTVCWWFNCVCSQGSSCSARCTIASNFNGIRH